MSDEEGKIKDKETYEAIIRGWEKLHEGIKEFSNLLEINDPDFADMQTKIALFILSFYCVAGVSREPNVEKGVAYQRVILKNLQESIFAISKQDKDFAQHFTKYMKEITGIDFDETQIDQYRIMKTSNTIH